MGEFNFESIKETLEALSEFKNHKFLYAITCRPDYYETLKGVGTYAEPTELFGIKIYLLEKQKAPYHLFYFKEDLNAYLKEYKNHEKQNRKM